MLAHTNYPYKAKKRYEKAENCILSLFPIFYRWVPLKHGSMPDCSAGTLNDKKKMMRLTVVRDYYKLF